MDKYIVKMTLEQWVEAKDEDDAVEITKGEKPQGCVLYLL